MSSSSRYVPSPIELARNRIALLEAQLETVNKVKREMLANMELAASGNTEAKVQAVSFGELAVQAYSEVDVRALVEAADSDNAARADGAAGVVEFFERFETDSSREEQAAKDAAGYLAELKARASRLVAISSKERDAISRFTRRCDELAAHGGSVEDMRPFVETDLKHLCSQLDEGNSAKRADVYIEYLALCKIAGEQPRDITYAEAKDAIQRIKDKMAMESFSQMVSSSLDEALREVGLRNAGTITLNSKKGSLVVDDEDNSCALFVVPEDDGAFLFTTIAAKDPFAMSQDDLIAAQRCTERLCSKKSQLIEDALNRRGIVAEVAQEYPPDLAFVEQSDEYAAYLSSTSRQRKREFYETDTVESTREVGL